MTFPLIYVLTFPSSHGCTDCFPRLRGGGSSGSFSGLGGSLSGLTAGTLGETSAPTCPGKRRSHKVWAQTGATASRGGLQLVLHRWPEPDSVQQVHSEGGEGGQGVRVQEHQRVRTVSAQTWGWRGGRLSWVEGGELPKCGDTQDAVPSSLPPPSLPLPPPPRLCLTRRPLLGWF